MLEVRDLTKYYRGIPVVDHVSFVMHSSQVTGYLGPNGSGKSTTVKMLTGLIEPFSGKIFLDGDDIRRDLIGYKRRVGYVPEEAHVYGYLTALEYLQLMGRLRELPERIVNEKANELLRLFSLQSYRHARISTYSKGMKQRVLLASALLHNPEILILDEPLSGLDVASGLLVKDLLTELARAGKTVLYISHVLEVVEKICQKVVVIYKGRIQADDSVERLRDLMQLPSLETIFAQLVQQEDTASLARGIATAMRGEA